MKHYTLKELQKLPTIRVGQVDDLKIETEDTRIWLSRLTKEDGQPYDNMVTVEQLRHYSKKDVGEMSRWVIIAVYQAV